MGRENGLRALVEEGFAGPEDLAFSPQGAPGGFPRPASSLKVAKMQRKAHVPVPSCPSLVVGIQRGHLRDGGCCVPVSPSLSGTPGFAKSWLLGIP